MPFFEYNIASDAVRDPPIVTVLSVLTVTEVTVGAAMKLEIPFAFSVEA